ncbi:MAG TPA: AAA family ATPase, partial [Polyangiaceae bacterium]
MRIRALRLLAFGPFRERTLRFDSDGAIELVYGPNEAGKSTTRRAVLGLLFGIPQRSKDGHSAGEARVGATLVGDDGRALEIVRRKGAKNTLLDPSENILDEGVLARWLGGMDAETYELAYGLDHEGLRHGGAALRVGKGQLGESLFSAATGLTGLHGVLAGLQSEADAIYRPRGAQLPLNLALRTFAEAKKRIAQLATTSDKWLEVEKQIEGARGELRDLRAKRAAAFEERERARAVAGAARALEAARARLAEIDEALSATNAELAAIDAPAELLGRAQAVAGLQERLGSHRKARADRPRIAAELEAIEERARRAEKGAPRGAKTELPPDARVRKLAMEAERLRERERQIESREAEQASAIARASERLAAMSPLADDAALRDALEAARREGDVEARLDAAARRAERDRTEAEARARSLGGFSGSLEELVVLPVPPSEVVAAHARDAAAIAERRRATADRRRRLEEDRADAERALAALRAEGDVPTEETLARARADRDALWEAVRGGSSDATRYERAVRAADEIADRLRREASRVSRASELGATSVALARKLEIVGDEERAIETELAAHERAWTALGKPSGLSRSPEEMLAWLARWEIAAAAASRAIEAGKEAQWLASSVERVRGPLRVALERAGEPCASDALSSLERAATRALAAREKSAKERAALESARDAGEQERDRIARERAACERERATWSAAWSACTRALGLPDGASPDEVTTAMDALADLARAEDDLEKTRRRLDGIDRDAARFTEDVRAIASACAPDLVGAQTSIEDACAELARRLAAASERRARRETLEEQQRKQNAQAADARALVEQR